MPYRQFSLVVLVVVFAGAHSFAEEKKEKKTELEGTWILQSAMLGGKTDESSNGYIVIIEGNKIFGKPKKGEVEQEKDTFTLDVSKSPKHIDSFVIIFKKKIKIKGIYKIEGDTLRICFDLTSHIRPSKLESQPDTDQVSLVLKRKTKKG